MTQILIAVEGASPGLYRISEQEGKLTTTNIKPFPSTRAPFHVTLSQGLDRIASVDRYGHIEILSLAEEVTRTGEFIHQSRQVPMVIGLAFIGNGILVSAGSDCTLRFLDLKTGKLIDQIMLPGLIFSLTALDDTHVAGITRDQIGDHLVAWNVFSRQEVFRGPPFKMPAAYMDTRIDFNPENGLITHGDRFGKVYLYDSLNNYQITTIETGHRNLSGVLFAGYSLLTAGEEGLLQQWILPEGEKSASLQLSDSVRNLHRLDGERAIALLGQRQLQAFRFQPDLQALEPVYQPGINCCCGPSRATLDRILSTSRQKQVATLLRDIQRFFEEGRTDEAYKLIEQLEQMGFQEEALGALAEAERAMGNLLNELESLLSLVGRERASGVPENIPALERAADILESIHEPESAIEILLHLAAIHSREGMDDAAVILEDRIVELHDRCILENQELTALRGFANPEMAWTEFRKAHILNRKFESPLAFHEEELKPLEGEITLESVAEALRQEKDKCIGKALSEAVIWKSGALIQPDTVLKIKSPGRDLPHLQTWLGLREVMGEQVPCLWHVFVPGGRSWFKDWNMAMLEAFKEETRSPLAENWFKSTGFALKKILADVLLESGTHEDDEFL